MVIPVLTHKVVIGDSRHMVEVADGSVHLVATSPPYWQLKDYGPEHQIGFHDTYEEYVGELGQVWQECYRVLAPGCRLCINIGDQFTRSVFYGRYKVIPIREDIIRSCEAIGFDYMGAIIWQKKTTMNTSGGGGGDGLLSLSPQRDGRDRLRVHPPLQEAGQCAPGEPGGGKRQD